MIENILEAFFFFLGVGGRDKLFLSKVNKLYHTLLALVMIRYLEAFLLLFFFIKDKFFALA